MTKYRSLYGAQSNPKYDIILPFYSGIPGEETETMYYSFKQNLPQAEITNVLSFLEKCDSIVYQLYFKQYTWWDSDLDVLIDQLTNNYKSIFDISRFKLASDSVIVSFIYDGVAGLLFLEATRSTDNQLFDLTLVLEENIFNSIPLSSQNVNTTKLRRNEPKSISYTNSNDGEYLITSDIVGTQVTPIFLSEDTARNQELINGSQTDIVQYSLEVGPYDMFLYDTSITVDEILTVYI